MIVGTQFNGYRTVTDKPHDAELKELGVIGVGTWGKFNEGKMVYTLDGETHYLCRRPRGTSNADAIRNDDQQLQCYMS